MESKQKKGKWYPSISIISLVPPDSMCLSCDQACAEKYAFFPCGHQPFCNICKEFPTCTVCNQDVVLRLKLISRET